MYICVCMYSNISYTSPINWSRSMLVYNQPFSSIIFKNNQALTVNIYCDIECPIYYVQFLYCLWFFLQ